MSPAVEMLLAVVAFYTLTFLWFVLPDPELETVEQTRRR
jgi:type II secretory pathway component PulM